MQGQLKGTTGLGLGKDVVKVEAKVEQDSEAAQRAAKNSEAAAAKKDKDVTLTS